MIEKKNNNTYAVVDGAVIKIVAFFKIKNITTHFFDNI